MKTECSKCQAAMPPPKQPPASESPWPGHAAVFVVTGYKCKACGHFNDLKRRRGYAAWRSKQMEASRP